MSLADQSQQWFPTSVQVTVHQARNLRVKGKNGTNDAYAIIQVAKDKFSTSVAEKCVAPVWKEEASFDLPLFHPGNAERCTLYIIVMHRAHVGLDKFLGQAVVNLLNLHDDKSRKKTDWYKLVDKTGKEDKARGEVLLDIIFLRNNMSASMFDLSMQDKPRSRISKLKDKVRGKKKDGFSDSASAIVPSVSQVLTDSEGEPDAQSLNQFPGTKKKSKLKTLFGPKSNLQRNISQSMSTLGTLPEKNSSLSGSRSSGLNVDSPEGKKKFKFLGHKRSGSSDSKVSQGPFSLLGRNKQSTGDLNNLCINGSHVYTEEESKSGSTLSLNSSGPGSVEDIRKHSSEVSVDTFRSVPVPSLQVESTDRSMLEQQHHLEEEERRQAEEKRIAEAKKQEEEEKYRAAAKRLQEEEQQRIKEEQERKRRFLEDEARRKKQEEEEERRKQEEELKMREAAEKQRFEEERRKAEEQKHQEEASMSDRLSSLFGIIKKKEEKKEEAPAPIKEELPPTPLSNSKGPDLTVSHRSTNPFEDVSLSSDPRGSSNESPADQQKSSFNPQPSSAVGFLNRSAKVSAVKPRSNQSVESEPADSQSPSQSPIPSEPVLSSAASNNLSNLHLSLAQSSLSKSPSSSPCGSSEDLSSVGSSSPTMAEKKKRAPLPPSHPVLVGNHHPVRELQNPAYVDVDVPEQGNKPSLPLPDYETLFPQRRHGVQGHAKWDNIIAEVNLRRRDPLPELIGPEMSVDGPEEPESRSSYTEESPAMTYYQPHAQETKPVSSKKVAAPPPPKSVAPSPPRSVSDFNQGLSQKTALQPPMRSNPFPLPGPASTDVSSREGPTVKPRDEGRRVLRPSAAALDSTRPTSQTDTDLTPKDDQRQTQVVANKEPPTAKPRQKANGKDPLKQEDSALAPTISDRNLSGNIQSSFDSEGDRDLKDSLVGFDPFPSAELLSKDPWAQPKQNKEDLFAGIPQKDSKLEDQGMTAEDLDNIFRKEKPTDPFTSLNGSSSNGGKDDVSPAFLRRNSSRRKQPPQTTPYVFDNKSKSQQEPAHKEETNTTANGGLFSKDESVTPKLQADVKTQSPRYRGEDAFGDEPFNPASSQPLPVVMEEPASQTGGVSGGKAPVRAWVSPSEVQPVSAQNSNGGGLALSARRPHPVKPMSSSESQNPFGSPAVKEMRARDGTPGKIQVGDSGESGPYTQLTQEELITMVVKQQTDLSRKDAKIIELEEYIDNLLVRVIEEKPAILQSLNSKPA